MQRGDYLDSRSFPRYTLYFGTAQQVVRVVGQEWLVKELAQAMPTLKIKEYFAAQTSWFLECESLMIAVEATSNRLVAMLASNWIETDLFPFLHIKIQMIASRYQKTHLLKHMWGFHLRQLCNGCFGFPSIIALKTFHPAVFAALRVFLRIRDVQIYPAIATETQSSEMIGIARHIANFISPGLEVCLQTGVIKNASIPPDFYPSLPEIRKTDVQQYFKDNLTSVDRLLCILHIPSEAAKHRILQVLGEKPSRNF